MSSSNANRTIDEVRALREAGRDEEHQAAALALVAACPGEPGAQFEAACAWDRAGDERRAVKHYDIAYRLGVPEDLRRRFLIGYSSTLRKVGRVEEAVAILAQAVVDDPGYPAFTAFLALALADAGHPGAALATMLGCALDAAQPGAFEGYERSLASYQRRLLGVDDGL